MDEVIWWLQKLPLDDIAFLLTVFTACYLGKSTHGYLQAKETEQIAYWESEIGKLIRYEIYFRYPALGKDNSEIQEVLNVLNEWQKQPLAWRRLVLAECHNLTSDQMLERILALVTLQRDSVSSTPITRRY